ncbi:MAG: hypothetical protein IPG89_07110 [Bacteroidetes bacterium]|nr:hypothetical protein [Bacteroidota bacterium]
MYSNDVNDKTFNNHSMYNNYLSLGGMRQNDSGTKPSLYITEVKLRKALKELSDIEIENIYEKEMSNYNCKIHRNKLIDKIESLHDWQLLAALSILLDVGRYESILYVKNCKRGDKETK